MALHPEAEAFRQLRLDNNAPAFHTLSAEQMRAGQRAARLAANVVPPDLAEVRDLLADTQAGDIALRLYRPAHDMNLPALIFLHGGGWATGDLESHDILCRRLALASGCALIAVDYRLAPEHPFPAGLDDVWAATAWIFDKAAMLGIDPSRIGIGGDSAGGNLATVCASQARDAGAPALRFQFLLYPSTDQRPDGRVAQSFLPGIPVDDAAMTHFRELYLTDPALAEDPRLSPILADLAGVAPAYLLTVGCDPLRDEGRAYAAALSAAGVQVVTDHIDDQMHGMLTFGTMMPSVIDHTAFLARRLAAGLTT